MAQAKVFIIDDDDDIIAFLSSIVTEAGHEVEAYTDGGKALDALTDQSPALVFLDVQMPKMNGFQVLSAIRERSHLAEVPVVMLSGISAVTGDDYDPDVIESRYGVRPTAFVNKGGNPAKVRAELEPFLQL
jgi:two-component system, OmpR family, response regulator AdeR